MTHDHALRFWPGVRTPRSKSIRDEGRASSLEDGGAALQGRYWKAPKGKLPYIVDDGEAVGDSTFIRWHIEKKYQIDFDRGLTPEQRAIA
jgi:Glutathione S-transferase N-terminal domain